MASVANTVPGSDLEVKACAELLESAKKRARIAFFLSLAVSCIVVLMVINLWESRQLRNSALMKNNTLESSEYLKEYSKHIADSSFYQLPALGIQVTCDNVGLLGPLALMVFSLYSLVAFRDYYSCVRCVTQQRFEGSLLVRTLIETERPLDSSANMVTKLLFFVLPRFLFVPSVAFIFVAWYAFVAHFRILSSDPFRPILETNSLMKIFDICGVVLGLILMACNWQAFQFSKNAAKSCQDPQSSEANDSAKAAVAGTTPRP